MPVNAFSDGIPSRGGQTGLLWKLLQDLTPYRVLRRMYWRYFSLILSIPNIQWHSKYLHVILRLLYSVLDGLFIVPIFRAHFRVLSSLLGALWLRSPVRSWLRLPGAAARAGHGEGGPQPVLSSHRTWVSLSKPPAPRAWRQGEARVQMPPGHRLRDHRCAVSVSLAGPEQPKG